VLGWLVGIARAGTALALQITINLINMAATVLLVLVLNYGIAGAALAAVLAETAGVAIGLVVAWSLAGGQFEAAVVFRRDKLLRMLTVNRDIMIRTAALIAAFAFFTAQGARAGDVALAAKRRAAQFHHGRQLFPRWPRDCGRTALRPHRRSP